MNILMGMGGVFLVTMGGMMFHSYYPFSLIPGFIGGALVGWAISRAERP